jgi:glycosyltransferase involved in cell wall biosynthesis
MGIPVVGTSVDAVSGVVRHQVEGLIADSDTEISLALQRLAARPDEMRLFSGAAIERGGHFSIENVANQMLGAVGIR